MSDEENICLTEEEGPTVNPVKEIHSLNVSLAALNLPKTPSHADNPPPPSKQADQVQTPR